VAAAQEGSLGDPLVRTGGVVYKPGPAPGSTAFSTNSGGTRYAPRLVKSGPRAKRRRAVVPPGFKLPVATPRQQLRVPPQSATGHAFPVAGAYSLGGEDAKFGARRGKRRHAGHDIMAAEGTPVVAPRGGTITWRAFQARGAGYYLVLDSGDENYYYVFMHLRSNSVGVRVGDKVSTGQALAQVGSTGSSSTPHLHFEIWDGPWYAGGVPIDPLPFLLAWK
jgi:murein DD-endopeptidase MepM/ murein hydrolase activator NlpD